MKYVIEYSLVEDSTFEGVKECNSMQEVDAFLSVMEGFMSYYHIYDENGNEV